ncbi:hypothetical protein ACFL1Z_08640 [Thermodesulfobacteriota bacterium]
MCNINKDTFELHRIPIGKNVYYPLNFTVYPQTKTVFIQSYNDVGVYVLPEKDGAM